MSVIIRTELQSDLQTVYKNASELLTLLQAKDFENESEEIRQLIEFIKFKLEDMEGTLQKDIFHCDYLTSKVRMLSEM